MESTTYVGWDERDLENARERARRYRPRVKRPWTAAKLPTPFSATTKNSQKLENLERVSSSTEPVSGNIDKSQKSKRNEQSDKDMESSEKPDITVVRTPNPEATLSALPQELRDHIFSLFLTSLEPIQLGSRNFRTSTKDRKTQWYKYGNVKGHSLRIWYTTTTYHVVANFRKLSFVSRQFHADMASQFWSNNTFELSMWGKGSKRRDPARKPAWWSLAGPSHDPKGLAQIRSLWIGIGKRSGKPSKPHREYAWVVIQKPANGTFSVRLDVKRNHWKEDYAQHGQLFFDRLRKRGSGFLEQIQAVVGGERKDLDNAMMTEVLGYCVCLQGLALDISAGD